jgi:hypothetical protein
MEGPVYKLGLMHCILLELKHQSLESIVHRIGFRFDLSNLSELDESQRSNRRILIET